MFKAGHSWADLEAHVRAKITETKALAVANPEKFNTVVDSAAKKIDDLIDWGGGPAGVVLEQVDGPVLRVLMRAFVQHIFNDMRVREQI
jgi:hypothetical protein